MEHATKKIVDMLEQYARNGKWGTCVNCPIENDMTYPERCKFFKRYDHDLDKESLKGQTGFWIDHGYEQEHP